MYVICYSGFAAMLCSWLWVRLPPVFVHTAEDACVLFFHVSPHSPLARILKAQTLTYIYPPLADVSPFSHLNQACRVVLTSVPKGMRTVLFDGKDAPFDRKDPRLRPVPFAVGKPIFEEVVAVHTRVTSIVFSDASTVTFDDPKPASISQDTSKAGTGAQGVNAKVSEAVAGLVAAQPFNAEPCPPSIELVEACERGDVDAAAALLDRLELNGEAAAAAPPAPPVGVLPGSGGAPAGMPGATATGWTAEEVLNHPDGFERLMTPLHVAAAGGHVAVLGLLMQRGANPLAEDVRGRVPYLLASNKETRDAFRRARAGLPERWDWDAARVPEPLTEVIPSRQKLGAGGDFVRCGGIRPAVVCLAGRPCLSRPKSSEIVLARKVQPHLERDLLFSYVRQASVLAPSYRYVC